MNQVTGLFDMEQAVTGCGLPGTAPHCAGSKQREILLQALPVAGPGPGGLEGPGPAAGWAGKRVAMPLALRQGYRAERKQGRGRGASRAGSTHGREETTAPQSLPSLEAAWRMIN